METNKAQDSTTYNFEKIVDILIRLGVLVFLFGWCIDILRPFVLILIWAGVIAIAVFPVRSFFMNKFRMKKNLASVVVTLIMLSILIIPSWIVTQSLVNEVGHLSSLYKQGQLVVPAPGPETADWPRFAQPLVDFWKLASENLQGAVMQYSDQLKALGSKFLSALAGIGMGILQFVASIIIAGVLLAYSASVGKGFEKILVKLAGPKGEAFIGVIVSTVQSVVKGILGVALIQAAMAGLGFFIAGVPYAGIWTVIVLVLAIIQLGAGPVAIPVMIYMFSATDTLTATLLAIWLVITLISDNILKPLLLGRGAAAPMLVVFLGAIGGMIASGLLGLFLGAVVLTIAYKLFMLWLDPTHSIKPELEPEKK